MSKSNFYEFRIRRIRRSSASELGAVADPFDAAKYIHAMIKGEPRENFIAMHLDNRLNVLGVERVAVGGMSGVDVAPRELFRAAILAGAHSVILGHNHPSGCTTPSGEDMSLTVRFVAAGKILGIPIADHIIVTDYEYKYYSMQDKHPGLFF